MERQSGLEPDKSGFAIRRLDHFGIRRQRPLLRAQRNSPVRFEKWLREKDLNLRSLGSEPSAFPLGYPATLVSPARFELASTD